MPGGKQTAALFGARLYTGGGSGDESEMNKRRMLHSKVEGHCDVAHCTVHTQLKWF